MSLLTRWTLFLKAFRPVLVDEKISLFGKIGIPLLVKICNSSKAEITRMVIDLN